MGVSDRPNGIVLGDDSGRYYLLVFLLIRLYFLLCIYKCIVNYSYLCTIHGNICGLRD